MLLLTMRVTTIMVGMMMMMIMMMAMMMMIMMMTMMMIMMMTMMMMLAQMIQRWGYILILVDEEAGDVPSGWSLGVVLWSGPSREVQLRIDGLALVSLFGDSIVNTWWLPNARPPISVRVTRPRSSCWKIILHCVLT